MTSPVEPKVIPPHVRFDVPDRPIFASRFRTQGLGEDSGDKVPSRGYQSGPTKIPGQQHADANFTAIRGRSRFFALLTPRPVGHGTAQDSPAGRSWHDPSGGRSQFDERPVAQPGSPAGLQPHTEFPVRTEFDPSLGQDDVGLARRGVLDYERNRGPADVGAQVILGPPSWYAAGPIPHSIRRVVYTLRREFMQYAQSFPGIRLVEPHDAPGSATARATMVRMAGPYTNRLTDRRLPASFGATTEVIR